MPQLMVRNAAEVPTRSNVSRAAREHQEQYEQFIKQLDGNVGELHLEPDENSRSVKVRLRRASNRLSVPIEIWDANGLVYSKAEAARAKRGRPPAAK